MKSAHFSVRTCPRRPHQQGRLQQRSCHRELVARTSDARFGIILEWAEAQESNAPASVPESSGEVGAPLLAQHVHAAVLMSTETGSEAHSVVDNKLGAKGVAQRTGLCQGSALSPAVSLFRWVLTHAPRELTPKWWRKGRGNPVGPNSIQTVAWAATLGLWRQLCETWARPRFVIQDACFGSPCVPHEISGKDQPMEEVGAYLEALHSVTELPQEGCMGALGRPVHPQGDAAVGSAWEALHSGKGWWNVPGNLVPPVPSTSETRHWTKRGLQQVRIVQTRLTRIVARWAQKAGGLWPTSTRRIAASARSVWNHTGTSACDEAVATT